jgi:hypothetical protein
MEGIVRVPMWFRKRGEQKSSELLLGSGKEKLEEVE